MLTCFKEKFTDSGVRGVNFYFESGVLGVSDNHRMAYPFFARKSSNGSILVHLDTHTDCSLFRKEDREELAKIDFGNDIRRFVDHQYSYRGRLKCPVQYGNWIPALLDTHPNLFDVVYLICHKDCGPIEKKDLPKISEVKEDFFWSSVASGAKNRCFSIDVDYYYDSANGVYFLRSSFADPVDHFIRCICHVTNNYSGSPLFVALSPSSCGGWDKVMPFLGAIDRHFDASLESEVRKHL